MKLVQLPKVLHGGEILDTSIDCDGQLLVSGGADGKVNLWLIPHLQGVSKEASETEISSLTPLHTIECHSYPIQCLESSPSEPKSFISADVKGYLYHTQAIDDAFSSTLLYPFSSLPILPILDCSWSHDGLLVAWTTMDCRTCVYDVSKKTFQELSSLCETSNVRSGSQRSISFDPTNNYLVTMGDDGILYIYQYAYFQEKYRFRLIHKISRHVCKPLLHCKYRRISWSPDGELLCIPTATKNHSALISMVSRSQGWENRVSLVGHGSQCEAVLFLHVLYTDEQTSDSNARVHNIVATAGSDRILLIWNTTKETPVLVLRDIAEKDVVSLLWLKDGQLLFAGSLDGHISMILFEPNELGYTASPQLSIKWLELSKHLIKPLDYKYEPELIPNPSRRSTAPQIEYINQSDAVDALQTQLPPPLKSGSTEVVEKPGPGSVKSKPTVSCVGPITPEVIPAPNDSERHQQASSDILQSAMAAKPKPPSSPKSSLAAKSTALPAKQVVTTKNGRKRIQPQLISKNSNGNQGIPDKPAPSPSLPNGDSLKPSLDFEKPSLSVSEEFQKECKRAKLDDTGNGTGAHKKAKRELEPVRFIGSVLVNPNTTFAKVRLAVPKPRLSFQVTSKFEGDSCYLDIRNGAGNELKPTRITYMKNNSQLWLDFHPKLVLLVAEGNFFWAISTGDCLILVYSHGLGKRLMPPLVLGSPILFLECLGDFLMATTSVGEIFVWDIKRSKIEVSSNIGPLLELHSKVLDDGIAKSDHITMCSITLLGTSLVTLSNGNGYMYNKDMESWQTVSESWWSFGSQYWDSLADSTTDEQSIIDMMELKTTYEIMRKNRVGRGKYFNKISKNMIMKEGFENLENCVSLAHLENRILCCERLGESTQFKEILVVYCQRLCEMGSKAKLFEVFNDLYGPADDEKTGSQWQSTVCGFKKHDLLREIIIACVENRDVQRIIDYFARKVGLIDPDII